MRPDLPRLLALVSLAQLALAGCNGEQAFRARDGGALVGTGGLGGGAGAPATGGAHGGAVGTGGTVVGTGGAATGGTPGSGGAAGTGVGTGGQGGTPGTGGGAGGSAGMGGSGTGGRPTGPGANGSTCQHGDECMTGYCFDNVCCNADCSGKCRTCNGSMPGTCTLAATGTDPRTDCPMQDATTCGSVGTCNGSGDCKVYPVGTACGSTVSCDSTMAAVIPGQVCNGGGKCVNAAAKDCKGFLCSGGVCGSSCSDDTACVAGGFCSAASCVGTPNLAGNGDLETGTLAGWTAANGGPALTLTSMAASQATHTGQYALVETNRGIYYQGPSYNLPTGLGQYSISFWAFQKDDTAFAGVPQVRLACAGGASYVPLLQTFSMSMPGNTWVNFTGTVNTATDPNTGADCVPTGTTPGLVRSAYLYLNQPQPSDFAATPVAYPDLYVDDLVVNVLDGHNLMGNPNFEAGFADGWLLSAGSSTLQVSATVAHGGTHSLQQSTRSIPAAGLKYNLPTGAARYLISYWVLQTGTKTHALVLQPSYTCGSSTVTMPAIATLNADPGNWYQISGTVVLPPVDAPAGCVMTQASVTLQQGETGTCSAIECPDLYVDDTSITLH